MVSYEPYYAGTKVHERKINEPPQYRLGAMGLTLFGGAEARNVFAPDGTKVCTVTGPESEALDLIARLNAAL